MKSRSSSNFVKTGLFKIFTHTVIMCGYETWKMSKNDKTFVDPCNFSKNSILRCIFGPARESGIWRMMHNKEHYRECEFKILKNAGHIQRLPSYCIPKKALKADFTSNRSVEKPRFNTQKGAKEDAARLLRCRNWKLTGQIGKVWRQNELDAKGWLRAVMR